MPYVFLESEEIVELAEGGRVTNGDRLITYGQVAPVLKLPYDRFDPV